MKIWQIVGVAGVVLIGLTLGQLGLIFPSWPVFPIILLIVVMRQYRLAMIPLFVLGLTLGLWRGSGAATRAGQLQSLVGRPVVITGQILDDPAATEHGQTRFNLGDLTVNGRHYQGHIEVTSYPVRYKRGYRLRLTGKLKAPFGSAVATIGYPKPEVLSDHLDNLERWRQSFFTGLHNALPDPLASLSLGLLIGARALIPTWLQNQLTTVGLSHLIAVSGYNLTIIIMAVFGYLRPKSRYLATISSFWLIAGFVAVAGASASVVRAAVVAVLGLWARYHGRTFQPLALVMLAAAITGWYQPSYILHDVGWQLSFLAFLGIMVVAPIIEKRFVRRPHPLKSLFIESLSAQILTFPLIMLVFKQFSLIAPLANLLILPLVPLAMLASFVAGLAGLLIPEFASLLAWPAWLILRFMVAAIGWLAHWPWANMVAALNTASFVVAYALILGVILVWQRRQSVRTADELV